MLLWKNEGSRQVLYLGDHPYKYGNYSHPPLPIPSFLFPLLKTAKCPAATDFNSILLNVYNSGAATLWRHSDNEAELGTNPTILSLSLGGTRLLGFKPRAFSPVQSSFSVTLNHGVWLIMTRATQEWFVHSLLQDRFITSKRISLTFRRVHPD